MNLPNIPPLSRWKRWAPARPVLIAWGLLLLVLLWTYWPTLARMVRAWIAVDEYRHGFFVPVFAAFLLWLRQGMVDPWPRRGSWWALAFFAVWALMRWAIFYFNYERDADTLFPLLVGIAVFLGGWRALLWAWPSIFFLLFMVPQPARVAALLSQPLQKIATLVTVYVLQTIDIPAIIVGGHGNVIQLSDPANKLEVANACSGLKTLTLFFAICVGASFVLQARWWEKLIMVVSAVPIAVLSNVARITLHGVLTEWVSPQVGNWVHDNVMAIMMPLAMLVLWGEMALIARLIVEVPAQGPLSLEKGAAALARGELTGAGRSGGSLPSGPAQPAKP
jgi:exosortase